MANICHTDFLDCLVRRPPPSGALKTASETKCLSEDLRVLAPLLPRLARGIFSLHTSAALRLRGDEDVASVGEEEQKSVGLERVSVVEPWG